MIYAVLYIYHIYNISWIYYLPNKTPIQYISEPSIYHHPDSFQATPVVKWSPPSPRRTALPAASSRPLSRLLGKRTSALQRDGTTEGRQQARKGGKRGRLLWEKIHQKRYTLDLPTTRFITFGGRVPLFTNIGHGYWVGGEIDMQECQFSSWGQWFTREWNYPLKLPYNQIDATKKTVTIPLSWSVDSDP